MTTKRTPKKPMRIRDEAVSIAGGRATIAMDAKDLLRPAEFPPGIAPKENAMAMDGDLIPWAGNQLNDYFSSFLGQGLGFMGFAALAELSQRAEYRSCVETIASEMTRMWIKIKAVSTETEDKSKTDKIALIEKEFKRLKVRQAFRKAGEHDGFFGRGQIFLDFDRTGQGTDPAELQTSIGDGSNASKAKVNKNSRLARLKVIEPMWSYPMGYNANNPLAYDWYKPQTWLIMGKPVHVTRLLTFIGRELPDILKPAYGFCGMSLSQMLKGYVDNWLRTRQSVADLIKSFSVFVLKTDMSAIMQGDSEGSTFDKRMRIFQRNRDNRGVLAVDKDNEELDNISAPLSTLDVLQAQALEHISTASKIPTVKWTGEQPAGLNADSEGVMETWYDTVKAFQELLFEENINKILGFVQLGLFGEVDPDITFEFISLKQMDPKEQAEIRKIEAETDAVLINDCGSLAPEESRERIAADPETPYAGLNVDDLPDPADAPGAQQESGSEEGDDGGEEGSDSPFESAQDAALAIALHMAMDDADWKEGDHPRDAEGKFAYSASRGSQGNSVHEILKKFGYEKSKIGTPAGKPIYLHKPSGQAVVIEPPKESGAKFSSFFSHYNAEKSKSHEGVKFGSPALQGYLASLHGNPAFQKAMGQKKIEEEALAAANKAYAKQQAENANKADQEKAIAAYQAMQKQKAEAPKPLAPKPVTDPTISSGMAAEKSGFKAQGVVDVGDKQFVKYTKDNQVFEIDNKGQWTLESPGHITKQGSTTEGLEALLAGKPANELNALGVENTNASLSIQAKAKQTATKVESKQKEATGLHDKLAASAPEPSSSEKQGISAYTGSGYQNINHALRTKGQLTSDAKAFAEWLDKSSFPEDMTVYRKVSSEFATMLSSIAVEGMEFTERGFTSTSTNPEKWHGETKIKIDIKKGHKAASVKKHSQHPNEDEIVLQHGTRYRVKSIDFATKQLHVEVVQ